MTDSIQYNLKWIGADSKWKGSARKNGFAVRETVFGKGEGCLNNEEIIENLASELRRGTVVLGVLNQLDRPKYGYFLVQELSDKGVPVDGNTLYPLLRRLEKQGLLRSEWETSGSKPRKYYVRTPRGREVCMKLRDCWIETVVSISDLMKGD